MSRPHVELAHAPQIAAEPLAAGGWPAGAEVKTLSRDDETGAFTGVLLLPDGWRRGPGHVEADAELLVVSGLLRIGGELRGPGWYEWTPAGGDQEPWVAETRVELVFMPRSGAPDFVPGAGGGREGRIEHDTERLDWMTTPIPGPTLGIVLKVLRRTEAGETTWLSATPPRRRYTALEWHDVVEESFLIEGDIWLGNGGLMLPGSYFWRPPHVTHGPFYSRAGRVSLTWCSGPLGNHFVDDPRRTVEETRAEAAGLAPPTDYLADRD